MKVILIVLGIFVYLLIGGVVSYLMEFAEDGSDISCVFLWPLVVILLIILGTGIGMRKLAEILAEWLKTAVFEPMGEQIEIWLSKKGEEREDDYDN